MENKTSLYNIESNLQRIFNEIELNDGEITEELDEQLAIAQEEYIKKGESYASVINMFKGYIAQIKEEQERLNRRKKVFENRISRLENALFDAVQKFGPIETAKFKIGTRKSTSIEIDSERVTKLRNTVINLAKEIHSNGYINFGDIDFDAFIAAINANAAPEAEADKEEFIPYTKEDLIALKVNINTRASLAELFEKKDGMLEAVLDNEMIFNVDNDMNKTEFKYDLGVWHNLTLGGVKENVKLSIR